MLKLRKYFWPFIGWILLLVLFVAGQSVLDLWLPDIMANVIKQIQGGTIEAMLWLGLQALGIAAGTMLIGVCVSFLASRISQAIGRDLRKAVFDKVEGFSLLEIDKISTSSLITRTTNDITQIVQALNMIFRMMISAPIMLIGGVIMAVTKSLELTAVIAITAPIMLIAVAIIGGLAMPLFRKVQVKIDDLTQVSREGLTGVRVIRAFGNDDTQQERFNKANGEMTKLNIRVNRIMSFMMPVVTLLFTGTTIAIYFVASLNANSFDYVADASAVVQYAMRIMMSFMMLAMMFVLLPRAQACANRVDEVLKTPISVNENKDAAVPEGFGGKVDLTFEDVSFRFAGAEEDALSNLSIHAKPGETMAIIGGTGSGKSTVLNLINRFYDPTEGKILLGGYDIKELSADAVRGKIGYVPQSPVLFEGTIAENVRIGKLDATDEEVADACRIAHASEFIENLPQKYDAPVSQGGTNFSGGQKQRLGIARAIVRRPDVYIFDDSFSALDYKTDSSLRKELSKITKEAITIIVAQRVSTIMNAENIIVLKDGKIEGQGTHKELLKSCPEYHMIASSQLKEEEL